ncbi:DUF222 domain-containing protein, partial [Microbacterium sp. NPDC055683]
MRDLILELRADRARLDGLEAGAFAAAARVAEAQTARCGDASGYGFPWRSIALELATVLHLSPGEVEARLRQDLALTDRFPVVAEALCRQVITRRQADIIREHGERLPDEVVEEYSRRAVSYAEDATPGQVRVFAKSLAAELDPAPLPERHRRALDRRGTRVRALDDGLAEFILTDDAAKITAIHDRLTTIAKPIAAEEKRLAAEEKKRAAGGPVRRNAFGMRVTSDGVAVDANGYATHPHGAPHRPAGPDAHGPGAHGPRNGDRRTIRSTLPGCAMMREQVEVFHDGTWYPHDPALPLRPTAEQVAAAVERG